MAEWGFYERDRELKDLCACLAPQDPNRGFSSCHYVIGRRRVGKTELLIEALNDRDGDDRPHVGVTVRADENTGEVESAASALAGLKDAVRAVDPTLIPEPDAMAEMERRPTDGYAGLVAHLLRSGAVVTVDGFQRTGKNHTLGEFQETLNNLENARGPGSRPYAGRPWGTLVIMGSHQQKMLKIVGGPLYGLTDQAVDLKPWNIRQTFKVAAEHGLLAKSERFLTLWAAFQGMPERWKDFVMGGKKSPAGIRDFHDIPDDGAWRRGFVERELAWTRVNVNRFDHEAFISLAEGYRLLMAALGRREYRKGLSLGEFEASARDAWKKAVIAWKAWRAAYPETFPHAEHGAPEPAGPFPTDDSVWKDLERLRDHLGLVRDREEFLDPDGDVRFRKRWCLNDGVALFQTRVFPEFFKRDGERPTPERVTARKGPTPSMGI